MKRQDIPKTGWPPGLLQDDSTELSRWLSSRMDAKECVRRVASEMKEAKELEFVFFIKTITKAEALKLYPPKRA